MTKRPLSLKKKLQDLITADYRTFTDPEVRRDANLGLFLIL